jgi:hypothetical protein
MKKRFRITYEVVTAESARNGESAHSGFLPESKEVPLYRNNMPKNPALFTLRESTEILQIGRHCEADSSPCVIPRWLTVNLDEDFPATNNSISLSLHLGDVSPASARRIGRIFGAY